MFVMMFDKIAKLWVPQDIRLKQTEYFRVQMDANKESEPQLLLRYLDNIDVKSAPLLSHVSMMIAVLGISAAAMSDDRLTRSLLMVEIAAYIVICLAMLRCLNIIGDHSKNVLSTDNYVEELRYEVFIRRIVYTVSLSATALVTLAFLVTILINIFNATR